MSYRLFVVPLQWELKALKLKLEELGHEFVDHPLGSRKAILRKGSQDVFVLGGHGKAQCALQTQSAIEKLGRVSSIVLLGSAGGLSSSMKPFDVVIGFETIEHDYRERFKKNSQPPKFVADKSLVESFRGLTQFQMQFGAIASGDEDIVDPSRAREVQMQTGAVVVAWEGAGAARAALFSKIPFLEIRAITDTADHQAVEHWEANLNKAMANLALILSAWVTSSYGQ